MSFSHMAASALALLRGKTSLCHFVGILFSQRAATPRPSMAVRGGPQFDFRSYILPMLVRPYNKPFSNALPMVSECRTKPRDWGPRWVGTALGHQTRGLGSLWINATTILSARLPLWHARLITPAQNKMHNDPLF